MSRTSTTRGAVRLTDRASETTSQDRRRALRHLAKDFRCLAVPVVGTGIAGKPGMKPNKKTNGKSNVSVTRSISGAELRGVRGGEQWSFADEPADGGGSSSGGGSYWDGLYETGKVIYEAVTAWI